MWTDERVEMLKKLWGDGLSASQVAKQLGGVTRNAVIGKVHRLGLSGRATPSRPARPRPQTTRTLMRGRPDPLVAERHEAARAEVEAVRAEAVRPEAQMLEPAERATVLTLTEHTCKWPIGDPGRPGFHFCGRGADSNAPYCTEHARLAYQPVQPRRNRDRTRKDSFAI
ncbi:MAG: GcrA family cell cycle regulator [Parvibaculum sp.]|jgi:GcrA cell cycle regulator|uniref:GcrA family cell cycle regulator n=1 Tax=Parvibaculum sp. TaxID=2024848 RepID=UPI0028472599|nr:GcrA family cell cycle regulator [Parvibaculum sp.]MDR3498831.1 GcrA family cell cycle regulator [Parvibaculum sp.]